MSHPRLCQDEAVTLDRMDTPAGYRAWLTEVKTGTISLFWPEPVCPKNEAFFGRGLLGRPKNV